MIAKKFFIILLTVTLAFTVSCSGNGQEQGTVSDTSQQTSNSQNEISSNAGESEVPSTNSNGVSSSSSVDGTDSSNSAQSYNEGTASHAVSSEPEEPQTVSVTVPEGYTFMQVAQLLEEKGICSAKDFYDAAQSYTVKSFTIPESSDRVFKLEGYLYPDTYEFYKPDKPTNVIIKMLNNYAAKSGMPYS